MVFDREKAANLAIKNMVSYDDTRIVDGMPSEDHDSVREKLTHRNDDLINSSKRKELYAGIISDFFEGKKPVTKGEQAYDIFVAGPFGVGKDKIRSNILEGKLLPEYTDKFKGAVAVVVDFDKIRESLPEYQDEVKNGNEHASSIVRAEVSGIAVAVSDIAKAQGFSIIEGDSKILETSFPRHADDNSRKVLVVGVASLEINSIINNIHNRGGETGRKIPEQQVRDSIVIPNSFYL